MNRKLLSYSMIPIINHHKELERHLPMQVQVIRAFLKHEEEQLEVQENDRS